MLLVDAVAAYTAGVDALLAADVDTATHRQLLNAFADVETGARRVPMAGYAILARLDREARPLDLGATSLAKVIAAPCRMSKGEVARRITRAKRLATRITLQGQRLAPEWEHTAAAHAAGRIGDEHVEVIRKFFKALPSRIDPLTRDQAEQALARAAVGLGPNEVAAAAGRLLAWLHPDGELSEQDAARKCGLKLGKQQPDGTSYLSGYISAKTRALLEPVLVKFAQRRHRPTEPTPTPADNGPDPLADNNQPDPFADGDQLTFDDPATYDDATGNGHTVDDVLGEGVLGDDVSGDAPADADGDSAEGPAPDEPFLDCQWRTKAQYTHDVIGHALELLLRSETLGTLNGLPTTVVVTTTLQELHAGAGYAVTAGGTRLPMRDLIDMAAAAYHYLAVFDGHTNASLHLGRAKRCATGEQKLVLFARDRGCTCPGCEVPFYGTQAHHGIADWKHDGQTNVDDMTLACGPDNRMIDTTDWTTRRRKDGRFEWIPPPHLDTGQTRTNDTHHPERLLRRAVEDDPL